jgi:hypothetical protein
MNPKNEWFKLRKELIVFLFVYFLAITGIMTYFLISGIFIFNSTANADIFYHSLITASLTSILGATVFYIRKLYKACINLDIIKPISDDDKIREIGVFFYFFLRPIISLVLSIVILLILKSGINVLATSNELTKNFFYLSIIISFFIGYSSGDLIDRFEILGKKVIDKIADINI